MVSSKTVLSRGLLALALALAGAAAARADEERCSELGSKCLCSEPLDNNDFAQWSSPSGAVWDPSDSPDSTECGYNYPSDGNMEIDPAGHYLTRAASDVPSGDRFNVLATYGSGITALHFTGGSLCNSSPARACMRWYRRWAPNYPSTGQCVSEEIKWFEANSGVAGGIQGNTMGDTFILRHVTPLGDSDVRRSGDHMSHLDCRDQWCRFEVCVSGNFCSSGNQTVEAWITGVDTGQEEHLGPDTQNTTGKSFERPLVNLWTTCSSSASQWTEVSHMLAADWPNNNGQRIGPAYEFESGTPSSPPAEPPAALPPAPPHLLED